LNEGLGFGGSTKVRRYGVDAKWCRVQPTVHFAAESQPLQMTDVGRGSPNWVFDQSILNIDPGSVVPPRNFSITC